MSIASQSLLTNSNSRFSFNFKNSNLKSPIFSLSLPYSRSVNPPHFQIPRIQSPSSYNFRSFHAHRGPIRAFESDSTLRKQDGINNFNLDAFLSTAEFLCLASLAVITIGFAVNSMFSSSNKPVLVWLGSMVSVWQFVFLVGGVVIGATIRRRQWRRICTNFSKLGGGPGVNLVERIEKLEEGLRSTATIIRVLSRQLEKLGIRFRVTRKALKEPIAETSALAQKNSEATRALAIQEDILEKELGEIQKVLLAMQEQQQKQLELIIAIGKTGKLWEGRRTPSRDQDNIESSNSAVDGGVKQTSANEIQALAGQKEGNDRV